MEFRNPELFITDASGKYPRLWALKGANPIDVRRWYTFGALASICTLGPGCQTPVRLLPESYEASDASWFSSSIISAQLTIWGESVERSSI
ncbi:hypothetical protein ACS0TY_006917 [Phlomoides rotata]